MEDIAGVFAGLFTAGLTGDLFAGIGTGIAVGQSLNAAYDAAANSKFLDALAGPLFNVPGVVQPITFDFQRPATAELVASVTYQFDSTTWNELAAIISEAIAAATLLNSFGITL